MVSSSGRFFDRVMPLGVLRYQRSIDGLETVVGLGHPGDELLQTRNVTRQDSSSKRVMGDSLVAVVCSARRTNNEFSGSGGRLRRSSYSDGFSGSTYNLGGGHVASPTNDRFTTW